MSKESDSVLEYIEKSMMKAYIKDLRAGKHPKDLKQMIYESVNRKIKEEKNDKSN